jgi:hypothetical protein
VPASLFHCDDPRLRDRSAQIAARLPDLAGLPIRLHTFPGLQDRRGPVHAVSFLRDRRIAFDCTAAEFPRIFVHELFHFVWLHAGNPVRWSFEEVIRGECQARAKGELGWSAEWRKAELTAEDLLARERPWREYICESFCDTAAWLYSGMRRHPEFTLAQRYRAARQRWFERQLEGHGLSI